MDITYTYEILEVDIQNRTMLVKYAAEGFDDHLVSTRIPYAEIETLEDVIKLYSPVNYWISLKLPITIPDVGIKGVLNTIPVENKI